MNSPVRRVKGTRWSWFGSTVWHGHCHIFWIPRNKQGNHPVGPACPRWSYAGRRDTDDRPTVIVAAVKGGRSRHHASGDARTHTARTIEVAALIGQDTAGAIRKAEVIGKW